MNAAVAQPLEPGVASRIRQKTPVLRGLPWLSVNGLAHAGIVAATLLGGFVAQAHERRVTAALLFMFAVVLVATRGGLRAGLLASVIVSIVYNLLLSEPFLRFGFESLDDLVPLLAFNISAVASAYVAGRLRDEARASQVAGERVRSLLKFSQDLQTAVELEDMLHAAQQSHPEFEELEVHLDDGRAFSSAGQPTLNLLASQLPSAGSRAISTGAGGIVLAERFCAGLVIGIVTEERATDAAAHLSIFAIAAERWALMQRLVDADVFRRSEEFKTTLLSSVSHDVRTPLAVISASAGSLLRYKNELPLESQRELLETIEKQCARLNQLTGKLLSLGKIEGGLVAAEMPEVDALDVLGAALVAVRQVAPARTITKNLDVKYAPVQADPALLEQVLYNVLENAVVHTPENGPIHVSAESLGGMLFIGVEDCGPGVAAADANLIFERFYQSSAGKQPERGSGLGLSIARGFARAIGGDLTVATRPNFRCGARFELTLPLVPRNGSND